MAIERLPYLPVVSMSEADARAFVRSMFGIEAGRVVDLGPADASRYADGAREYAVYERGDRHLRVVDGDVRAG